MTGGGGLRSAHGFIASARSDAELRDAISEVARDGDLEDLARLGRERGFDFTSDELRLAFSQDWTMRRLLLETEGS